jgi:hypothetical protein
VGGNGGPVAGPPEFTFSDDARPVHERLLAQKVNYGQLRRRRAAAELANCTFTPAIVAHRPLSKATQQRPHYHDEHTRGEGGDDEDAETSGDEEDAAALAAAAAVAAAAARPADVTARLCAEASRRVARRALAAAMQEELAQQACTFAPHLPALERREARQQTRHAADAKACRARADRRAADHAATSAAWRATQQRFGGNVRAWSAAYQSGLLNVPRPEPPPVASASFAARAAFGRAAAESAAAARALDRAEVAAGRAPREAHFNQWEQQVRASLGLAS